MRKIRFAFLALVFAGCATTYNNKNLLSKGISHPDKVIIDTDSAFFNDDLAAIAILLQSPGKVNIIGVTVTTGNLWLQQGQAYLAYLLEISRKGYIPFFLGDSSPLIDKRSKIVEIKNREKKMDVRERKWHLGWLGALNSPAPKLSGIEPPFGGRFSSLKPQSKHAVDFIIDSVRQNPGQLTILALGPMTNISAALEKAPDIAAKIKRIIFMGGAALTAPKTTPYAEFNVWFDAKAAKTVLNSEIPEKIMFGEEVTSKVRLRKHHFDRIVAIKTPITAVYEEDLGRVWPAFYKNPDADTGFWDTIPAVFLVEPSIVTGSKKLFIDVISDFGIYQGGMISYNLDREPKNKFKPVLVMTEFDFDQFFAIYKEKLTAPISN